MISELQVGFIFEEPLAGSFDQAVEAAERSDRAARARLENLTLANEEIIDFRIGIRSVELLLSGGRVLRINCTDDVVDWSIGDELLLPREPKVYAEEVQLSLPDGHRVAWHPDAILVRRKLVRGLAVAPTTTLVSLYVRGCGELMFVQMVDRGGERMLFFEEE